MNKIIITSVLFLLLIPLGYNAAFAKTWQIEIPTGAADPTAPFFYDPWELTVEVSDTVEWQNGDTAAHTVTSGTPTEGSDGKFDSGLFGPGQTFSYTFTAQDRGVVKYYCIVHPHMTGIINVGAVEEGFKVLHNVGSDAGDGKTTFDVEYTLDKVLADAKINENQKSITFTMAGIGKDGDKFVAKLPKDLIEGPLLVWVDNVQITDFEQTDEGDVNTLTIPLTAKSETVVIVGSAVVPEFGTIAAMILVISIIGVIVISIKRPSIVPKL